MTDTDIEKYREQIQRVWDAVAKLVQVFTDSLKSVIEQAICNVQKFFDTVWNVWHDAYTIAGKPYGDSDRAMFKWVKLQFGLTMRVPARRYEMGTVYHLRP